MSILATTNARSLTSSLALLTTLIASTNLATAQTVLTPAVVFSVHDQPVDGLGDSFNTAPFEGLIRTQSTRADRAMLEYDITSLTAAELANATLSGAVHVNNAFNNGLRTFAFELYAGNGQADLTDYQIPAAFVGTGSYSPPAQSSFTFSFDVTAELQSLLDCGATFVGLRATGTSNPSFPNILDAATQLTVTTTATPPAWTDLGNATPGAQGAPLLVGSGVLSPGNPTRLTICHQEPNLPGALIIGFGRIDLPLLGAFLVPTPDLAVSIPGNGAGLQSIQLLYPPPGGGGTPIYFQYWSVDLTAPQGLAVSNAVTTTAP